MSAFDYNTLKSAAAEAGVQTSYDPITPGSYDVIVDEATAKTSKGGDPQLVVVLKVTSDGEFKNRKVWMYLTFMAANPTATAIAFRNLTAFGVEEELLAQNNLDLVAGFLKGRRVSVSTDNREYNGKTYTDVKSVRKAEGVAASTGGSFDNPFS